MKQNYYTIIKRAVFIHLVLYGVQWPILMAWGYAVHPLACIGNIISLPCISTLLTSSTVMLLCFLCGCSCAPALSVAHYAVQTWLLFLQIPIPYVHVHTPCPHWSILGAIFATTWVIASYARSYIQAIAGLAIFFITAGYALHIFVPHPRLHTLYKHDTVVSTSSGGTYLFHLEKTCQMRYTENGIRYTLLPCLRRLYGREDIDYVVSWYRKPTRFIRLLNSFGLIKRGTISLGQLYALMLGYQKCPKTSLRRGM